MVNDAPAGLQISGMVGVMLSACFGGLYTPRWGVEMGLCTHLEFQDCYSYELWALDIL